MRERAGTGVLEAWYSKLTLEEVLLKFGKDADMMRRVKNKIAEARKQTHERVFNEIAHLLIVTKPGVAWDWASN
jgi:uncharacterized membrane protein